MLSNLMSCYCDMYIRIQFNSCDVQNIPESTVFGEKRKNREKCIMVTEDTFVHV